MRIAPIKEVARIETGTTPSTKKPEYYGGDIPFVKPADLSYDPRIIIDSENYVTGLGFGQGRKIPLGGVMVCSIGATIGKVGLAGRELITNQQINTAIFDEAEVLPKYGLYYFASLGDKLADKSSSTTVPIINKTNFSKLEIPIPSLSEQKVIVAKLDRAQRLIDIDLEMLAKYDELIQSVFLEMFGDPGRNEKGVAKRKIKDIGEVVTGNTPPKKNPENYGNEIEWVKTTNIVEEQLYPTTAEEYLSKKGKELGRIIPENSLIVCCIAGSLSSIGKCSIADREIAINQQINAIVPNPEIIDTTFLYAQLMVGKKLIQDASTKSMKGMVSKSKFQKIELLVPELSDQQKFSNFLKKVGREKLKLRSVSKKSEELFSSLVQGAFK